MYIYIYIYIYIYMYIIFYTYICTHTHLFLQGLHFGFFQTFEDSKSLNTLSLSTRVFEGSEQTKTELLER